MGHDIHLSVVTATGFSHADRQLGNDISISYLPWDIPGAMSRFIHRLQPALLLLTETEFWPGKLSACRKQRVPVVGINTRISDRSFPRYQTSRFLWRRWLAPVSLFLAQSRQDAERLVAIGVPAEKIQTAGNLKYAVAAPGLDAEKLRLKLDASGRRPILLVASSHEGEDALILNMWERWHANRQDLLTIFVPRHPERFNSVATLIHNRGHQLSRWSETKQHNADFILIDAMGVLGKLYSIADIVIIAGSLVDIGGHNPLEAAICGRGVVTGPYVQNFCEIMDEMKQSNAAIVAHDEQELEAAVNRLLTHPDELKALHANAALFIHDKAQVLDHILSAIKPYLRKAGIGREHG
jgi:3-deoxy-D-manno-octulosonic-acid transferase